MAKKGLAKLAKSAPEVAKKMGYNPNRTVVQKITKKKRKKYIREMA